VSGLVYKVEKEIQVWVGRGGVVGGGCGEGGGSVGSGVYGGEVSGGARVWTHSATSVTEEVCVAPSSEVYRRLGTQPAWSWGPVGSRLPSPGPNDGEALPRRHDIDRGPGR
jgi:hypothetical protein